jgi:low molecular weight protein-tyrosine phosphatase
MSQGVTSTWMSVLRDLLQHVRRTPERLLHPMRRRKAVAALRNRPRPVTVLAVCHGNICRSPVAAALLGRELATLGIDVQSAGFAGFNRQPPAEAMAAAERHGLDLTNHRSRLMTADLVRAANLIVVMDPVQRRLVCERFGRRPTDVILLGDFDPSPLETRTIRDPVDQSREVFDQVYERIARCVREVVTVLSNGG